MKQTENSGTFVDLTVSSEEEGPVKKKQKKEPPPLGPQLILSQCLYVNAVYLSAYQSFTEGFTKCH